jgi:hypothetical protein
VLLVLPSAARLKHDFQPRARPSLGIRARNIIRFGVVPTCLHPGEGGRICSRLLLLAVLASAANLQSLPPPTFRTETHPEGQRRCSNRRRPTRGRDNGIVGSSLGGLGGAGIVPTVRGRGCACPTPQISRCCLRASHSPSTTWAAPRTLIWFGFSTNHIATVRVLSGPTTHSRECSLGARNAISPSPSVTIAKASMSLLFHTLHFSSRFRAASRVR